MSDNRTAHPISPETYHEWRNHPVTVRLFEDLENSVISNSFDLSKGSDLSFFVGAKDTIEEVLEWRPEEIGDDEHELLDEHKQ